MGGYTAYLIRRVLLLIPTILIVATIVFLGLRAVPSDPAVAILGDRASEEALQQLRHKLGLNKPLWKQYLSYMSDLFRGNLGRSLLTSQPVLEQIVSVLPSSIELVLGGMLISILIGIPLGIISAVQNNSFTDYIARILSLTGISMPVFYLGVLLLLLFSVTLGWFPVISATKKGAGVGQRLHHIVLPALTLGLIQAAFMARLTRSAMLEILQEDYVSVARSKGLGETMVIYKHALRNALIPIVTTGGVYLGLLLGNSVLTETVFSRPGLGRLLVGAIFQRDYPVIQSVLLFFASFVAAVNLLVDLAYAYIDPRVEYD